MILNYQLVHITRISSSRCCLYNCLCILFCISDLSSFSIFKLLSKIYSLSYCFYNFHNVYWCHMSVFKWSIMAITTPCLCFDDFITIFYCDITNLYTLSFYSISIHLHSNSLDFSLWFTSADYFIYSQWSCKWNPRNSLCLFYLSIPFLNWSI